MEILSVLESNDLASNFVAHVKGEKTGAAGEDT